MPAFKFHVMTIPGTRDEVIDHLREGGVDVCLHEDPERRGILWNHLQEVECALANDEGWSIFASDDIELLPGWDAHLPMVMRFAPAPFVSITHFANYGKDLVNKGIPFGIGDHGVWGPAWMMHPSVKQKYVELVRDVVEMNYEKYRNWDDGIPTAFNHLYGTKSAMTSRALVEHRDMKSVMGHNLHWRHATATIRQPGPPWGNGKIGSIGLANPKIHAELASEILAFRRAKKQGEKQSA